MCMLNIMSYQTLPFQSPVCAFVVLYIMSFEPANPIPLSDAPAHSEHNDLVC